MADALGCESGTIDRVWDGERVRAGFCNLLPVMMEAVQTVPFGKGIAGLAAGRREPVFLDNLQTDDSGRTRPRARLSGLEGAIAVPMIVERERCSVLGVAKRTAHAWTTREQADRLAFAAEVGRSLRLS